LILSIYPSVAINRTFAFFFGLAVRQVGLPPLFRFLAADFAVNAFGP